MTLVNFKRFIMTLINLKDLSQLWSNINMITTVINIKIFRFILIKMAEYYLMVLDNVTEDLLCVLLG